MDVYDILQTMKDQLHDIGISEEALEELTPYTTIEELVYFLDECQLDGQFYIGIKDSSII